MPDTGSVSGVRVEGHLPPCPRCGRTMVEGPCPDCEPPPRRWRITNYDAREAGTWKVIDGPFTANEPVEVVPAASLSLLAEALEEIEGDLGRMVGLDRLDEQRLREARDTARSALASLGERGDE